MIEEDLDAALAREARREGRSKAAIIRRLVRAHVEPQPSLADDPLTRLAGSVDFAPEHHDDIVYG